MNREKTFWRWFAEHANELFYFERNQATLFEQLMVRLGKIHTDVTFEIGPEFKGRREFVISAGGIKRAFPSVSSLAAAAPEMPNWTVTAFRPRRSVESVVDFNGVSVDPKDVAYSLFLHDKSEIGLYLFSPGYIDGNEVLGEIGYLLLDEALGEYDVEMKLGLIKFFRPEEETPGPRFPLCDLAAHFDEAVTSFAES
jgi:hypothetical protein